MTYDELLAKIALLGPVLYLDSAFNMLDMFLVCLGLAKYVTEVPGFITNLRVIKLMRLLRLYRVAKLVDVNKDPKGFKDATITVGGLAGLVVDMSEAMMNTVIWVIGAKSRSRSYGSALCVAGCPACVVVIMTIV